MRARNDTKSQGRRSGLFCALLFVAALVWVGVAQSRHSTGTPWIGQIHLDGERVSTGPDPMPEITFRTYQAQIMTRLFTIGGDVADAFIGPPVGCGAFAQALYTIVVSPNDPGPGPWVDRAAFFAALGTGYKRVSNTIDKLTADAGQLASGGKTANYDFTPSPVAIPAGWYLTLETSFTNSGVGACQVLGTYDFEAQLVANVDQQMNRVR